MAYEVTATRKRPQSFEELAGQEFVVASLGNTLSSGHIAHAYLFSGPRGVGKTSAARILAKSLNCTSEPASRPCNSCASCGEVTAGNSIDVIEIDGASNTSVNDVREIREEVLFSPSASRYKVYIIDEIHMLSNSAFNALLKTIEEPPPYIVFIFATTEVHKVPATIRSRCQQFNFRLIGLETIVEMLKQASAESDIAVDDESMFWIGKEAEGSLRDAYTLFDQIVSFAEGTISMELIQEKLGLSGFDRIDRLATKLAQRSAREALELCDEIVTSGVSVERLVTDLADYFRGVLFTLHGIRREALIGFRSESFSEVVLGLDVRQVEYLIGELFAFYRANRYSLNQRFELELLISRLSMVTDYIDQSELVRRIEALGEGIGGDAKLRDTSGGAHEKRAGDTLREASGRPPDQSTEPKETAKPPETAATRVRSEEEVSATKGDSEVSSDERRAITDAIRKSHPSLATALENTEWILSGEELRIESPSRYHAERVQKDISRVSQVVESVTGRALLVNVRSAGRVTGSPAEGSHSVTRGNASNEVESEGPGAPNEASSEGRIEMIRRVFRGEIVETGERHESDRNVQEHPEPAGENG